MKKYIIEREIPNIGTVKGEELRQAAAKSNAVLDQLGTDIRWLESYITANKMFCAYLGKDESIVKKHAELSGFPAHKITEISRVVDTTTANGE